MRLLLSEIGRATMGFLAYLGGMARLFFQSLWWVTLGPLRGKGALRRDEIFYQGYRISWGSLGIVSMVIFFVGMIIAFQTAYVFEMFGVTEYVANMMGIAMVREIPSEISRSLVPWPKPIFHLPFNSAASCCWASPTRSFHPFNMTTPKRPAVLGWRKLR